MQATHLDPGPFLSRVFYNFADAWDEELGRMHRIGMLTGLAHPPVGAVYYDHVLAPSYQAFASLLRSYHQRGVLYIPDPDAAAVSLFAPVVMYLLGRHQLDSATPDAERTHAFIDSHLALFLRACAP